jgi:fatty acid desaturase
LRNASSRARMFDTAESPRLEKSAAAPRRRGRGAVEAPTLVLLALTYGGWLATTAAYARVSLWIIAPVVTPLLTLHSSLQHEIIHGHPTRWASVNRLLGMLQLSLWLPFERYRQNHLAHHNDERLTDPIDDSESYYWTCEDWAGLTPFARRLVQIQQTLAGRIIIGSFWRIVVFLRIELAALIRNEPRMRAIWVEHLLWCVPVIAWLVLVCHMPLWVYFVAMIIPSNGILLIRSFAEHRARAETRQRTAIVERAWLLGPLFLFNNLHALHHEEPSIPWYQYNTHYRVNRERLIAENGGLVYATYFDVARRYLFRAHDVLPHPLGRAPRRRGAVVSVQS